MIPLLLSMMSHASCNRLVSNKHVHAALTVTPWTMLMNPTRTPTPSLALAVLHNGSSSSHTLLHPKPSLTHPGTYHQAWPNMGTGTVWPPPTMGSSGTARTRDHRRRVRLGGSTRLCGLQQGQDRPEVGGARVQERPRSQRACRKRHLSR